MDDIDRRLLQLLQEDATQSIAHVTESLSSWRPHARRGVPPAVPPAYDPAQPGGGDHPTLGAAVVLELAVYRCTSGSRVPSPVGDKAFRTRTE